jgi:heavy metal translocating P-type ATPase
MILSLGLNLAQPEDAAIRAILHGVLALAALAVAVFAGGPVMREAWAGARRGRIVVEQLFLAGIAGALAASVLSSVTGHGAIYYEVVSILLAVYTLGRLLGAERQRAAGEAGRALEREFAWAWRTDSLGEWARVQATEVREGDRVRVLPGEGIAVDGTVVAGVAFVRQTPLTGEPLPVVRRPGDQVTAGGYVVDEPLVIQANAGGTSRQIDRLLEDLEAARRRPSRWEREADAIVAWFLPLVMVIAVAAFAIGSLLTGWVPALFNALAVLLVACPCALGLATPIAIWSVMNALASRGLLASSGDFVESLSRIDTVVFDKTGTLSEEDLSLVDFVTVTDDEDRHVLRRDVAALEIRSSHPLARAFHTGEGTPVEVSEVRTLPGVGIEGRVRGRRIAIGNLSLVTDGELLRGLREKAKIQRPGATHEIAVQVEGRLAGLAFLRECPRRTAQSALGRLAEIGVHIQVMSGDRAEAVAALGLAGLDAVHGEAAPQAKAELVAKLQAGGRHRVLFVGDGINDAPAMAQADASLALATGSALALETAGARLFGGNLTAIPTAIVMARHARRNLRMNLLFAAAYNFIAIALAATGWLHPLAAALLMLASSATVTWRALRLENRLSDLSEADDEALWHGLLESAPHPPCPPLPAAPAPCPASTAVWVLGVCLAIQGPWLGWLGQLRIIATVALTLLSCGLGAWVIWRWRAWSHSLSLQMTISMLALGNLGMLTGWWVDAGFGPVVADGLCLCGCPDSTLGAGILQWLNGMHMGMLAFGFPAMLLVGDPRLVPARARLPHALGMTAGMMAGMHGSAWVLSLLPLLDPHLHMFLTFAAMMLGMLLGMFAACGIWRIVHLASPQLFPLLANPSASEAAAR